MDVIQGSETLYILILHPLGSPWISFLTQGKYKGNWQYAYWVHRKVSNCRSHGTASWVSKKGSLSVAPSQALQDVWNAKELENKMQHSPWYFEPQDALLSLPHAARALALNAEWWHSHKAQPLTGLCSQTSFLNVEQARMLAKCNFLLN